MAKHRIRRCVRIIRHTRSLIPFQQTVAGAAGAAGAIGSAGAAGAAGAAGLAGAVGPVGPAGPTGLGGPAGVAGPQGPQGPAGAAGAAGPQGAAGLQGPIGPAGPTGAGGERDYSELIAVLTDALNFGQTLVITTPGQPTGGAIGTVSSLGDLQLQFNTQTGTTMTIPYYFITNVEIIGTPSIET